MNKRGKDFMNGGGIPRERVYKINEGGKDFIR
jgi:hypothetical protein